MLGSAQGSRGGSRRRNRGQDVGPSAAPCCAGQLKDLPMRDDLLAYYAEPAPMTALPDALRAETPSSVADVFALVQGVMMHRFWGGAYGETLTPARDAEAQLRSAEQMRVGIERIDPA